MLSVYHFNMKSFPSNNISMLMLFSQEFMCMSMSLQILQLLTRFSVFSLDRELRELKNNRSALIASLKNPAAEVVNVKRAGKKK